MESPKCGAAAVLDGITRYRFGMNPGMMTEWQAVKQGRNRGSA